jgi:RNA polymerase sigma factor (sigma-70 family)
MSDESFRTLIRRVRAGDQRAAEEVVRLYEAEIRREVRLRLRDPQARRVFDSMDVCQSVLASFFLRAASGQYELDDAGQLLRLLVRMTRNKVVDVVRRERSARRSPNGTSPLATGGVSEAEPVARGPTPSQEVSLLELEREFRERLSVGERRLAALRVAGRSWAQIAAETGDSPEALRKRLARAADRVCGALGVD